MVLDLKITFCISDKTFFIFVKGLRGKGSQSQEQMCYSQNKFGQLHYRKTVIKSAQLPSLQTRDCF